MLRANKKFITFLLSLVFCGALVNVPLKVYAVDKVDNIESTIISNINPIAQSVEELGEGFFITSQVNIVGENDTKVSTVRYLKDILKKNGIEISRTFNKKNTTIVLGEYEGEHQDNVVKDILENMEFGKTIPEENKEGYVLYTSNDNEEARAGVIVVGGKSESGTYYGINTLNKLIKSGSRVNVPEVVIEDYPDIEFRGVIEGVCGEQWSHENKKSILEFMGQNNMNTYIYSDKNDQYNSSKWRLEYPEGEALKIKELLNIANENNVDFIWSVNLSAGIKFTDIDYKDLINKLEKMYKLGVRCFAIFLDDLNEDNANPSIQAEFLNRVNREFIEARDDIKSLIIRPTENRKSIINTMSENYLDVLGEKLDKNINVLWNGEEDSSEKEQESIELVNEKLNRNVYFCWNSLQNNYCNEKLSLREDYNLDSDIKNISAFVCNPMNQAQASKFTLYSASNYAWNIDKYNSLESWEKAIKNLTPEVEEEFKIFVENNAGSYDHYNNSKIEESEKIRVALDSFKENLANKDSLIDDSQRLILEFKAIENSGKNIMTNCKNYELLQELYPWIQSFEQLGIAGQGVINSIVSIQNKDLEGWWESYSTAKDALERMNSISQSNSKKGGVKVSTSVLTPFVEEMIKISEKMYCNISKTEASEINIKAFLSYGNHDDIKNITDGDENTICYVKSPQRVGDYFGIDLGKTCKVEKINILQGRSDEDYEVFKKGKLQYSVDGETWQDIGDEKSGNNIIAENIDIEARYIKYVLTDTIKSDESEDIWTAIREFSVEVDSSAHIYSNIDKAKDSVLAIDDDTGMAYLNIDELVIGKEEYIGVELNSLSKVKLIKLYINTQLGNINDLSFEYSVNGLEWEPLDAKVDNNSLIISQDIRVKYIRVMNKSEGVVKGLNIKLEIVPKTKSEPILTTNVINSMEGSESLVDDKLDTFFILNSQNKGDYYCVDLGEEVALYDVTLYSDAVQHIKSGMLEVSENGKEWNVLNDFSSVPTSIYDAAKEIEVEEKEVPEIKYNKVYGNADGKKYRYIRIKVNSDTKSPAKIYEIKFNETIPKNNILSINSSIEGNSDSIIDGDINSYYIPIHEVKDDDYVSYTMTTGDRFMSNIYILQDKENISNAVVKVRTSNWGWIEVGVLDKAFNNIDLASLSENNKVLEINIEWNGKAAQPKIYELTPIYK